MRLKPALIHFPEDLMPLMNEASAQVNPDGRRNRSMFVRQAVAEKLKRMGLAPASRKPRKEVAS